MIFVTVKAALQQRIANAAFLFLELHSLFTETLPPPTHKE